MNDRPVEPAADAWVELLDEAGFGVLTSRVEDDVVTGASARAAALLGRDPSSVIGATWGALVDAGGSAPDATVTRWSPGPGRWLRAVRGAGDGAVRHTLIDDETDARARDEELSFLRRAVDRLDSLALAEHAAAAISHDLNNVLQSVVGLTQLARERPDGETLEALDEAAVHASRLARLLLETGRPRDDGKAEHDPAVAVERIEPLLECLLRRRLRLELVPHGRVALPRAALERIVINLAANARDATVAGGGVTVRVRPDRDEVVLEVEDEGVGMEPETLRRAKELSFTTKPDGTGLGLALVHRIVRRYGGRLSLESELGRGTRVVVRLPRAAG